MREDLWLSLEDLREQIWLAGEVRGEVLHTGMRVELVDLAHDLGVEPGTFILQVITGHTSDGGIIQLHLAYGLRDALWLFNIERFRLCGVDLAEVTAAGAVGTTDEEGGFAGFPALVDIGAASFLAHGVQRRALDFAAHVLVFRASFHRVTDPARLGFDRGLRVALFYPA